MTDKGAANNPPQAEVDAALAALRSVGKRSAALHEAAVAMSRRLAESTQPAPRWIGKDALRELTSPAAVKRLAARGRAKKSTKTPPKKARAS